MVQLANGIAGVVGVNSNELLNGLHLAQLHLLLIYASKQRRR